jgi:nitrate reductase molybdenum cofactor assembly chaperone NarJ/NarW
MKTFKALSALIDYPNAALVAALPEIRAALAAEAILGPAASARVEAAIAMLAAHDAMALQERWVGMFDRIRSLSLHLFEHVHGDSRERGPAMVDLLEHYRKGGFDLTAGELPDYLPVILEFAAQLPLADARALLKDVAPLLAPIQLRLTKRGSPYAGLIACVRELAGELEAPRDDGLPDRDPTLEEIDRDWAEAEVRFGPGDAAAAQDGCGKAAQWVARMNAS